MHAVKTILVIFIITMITACGYKPSSKFARDIVGEKVSTDVLISAQNPENTVIIKDAIDEAIVEIFHASLTSKEHSDSHLSISISTPSYTPVQYNTDGYIVGYRMSITLNITRYHSGISKSYTARGSYDFSVLPNAVVTDQERFEAIKLSAAKAINGFIAQVSSEGARSKKSDKGE